MQLRFCLPSLPSQTQSCHVIQCAHCTAFVSHHTSGLNGARERVGLPRQLRHRESRIRGSPLLAVRYLYYDGAACTEQAQYAESAYCVLCQKSDTVQQYPQSVLNYLYEANRSAFAQLILLCMCILYVISNCAACTVVSCTRCAKCADRYSWKGGAGCCWMRRAGYHWKARGAVS